MNLGLECRSSVRHTRYVRLLRMSGSGRSRRSNAIVPHCSRSTQQRPCYGQPRNIKLTLLLASTGLQLSIRDDGIGLPDDKGEGREWNSISMALPAEQIGGTLQIGDAEGGGTIVNCTL